MGDRKPPGFLASLPPVVRWLLISNVAVYLLDQLYQITTGNSLLDLGAFSVPSAVYGGQVWEFLTFQFLHFGTLHILMNSIGLFFLGPFLELAWGGRRFLIYYLLCGIGGALFYCLLVLLQIIPDGMNVPLVGASAGIYGILAGIAVISPEVRVSVMFLPITLTIRQLALWVMGISVFLILFRIGGNNGGDSGHLGGILAGFLLAKNPRLLDWTTGSREDVKIIRPKAFRRKSEAKIRPRTEIDLQRETEVDRILDKISRDGVQSLTPAEREILNKASQSNHPPKP